MLKVTFMRTVYLVLVLVALPLGGVLAEDAPTLAFLRFGQTPEFALTDKAVLDTLVAHEFISAEERAELESGNDLRGEKINILYRDAGFDMATASLMVEDALDEGADVMLTISTQVGMLAANAMSDMDDPPALIFAIVSVPYETGIASAPCLKPPNVTGTRMAIEPAIVDDIRHAQHPNLKKIGMLVFADDPASASALEFMMQYADGTGFEVETAAVRGAADFALATESLVNAGAEGIYISPSTGSRAGLSAVVNAAYGLPVYSGIATDALFGVTVGAGFQGWYQEGAIAGRMLAAYLRGELDVERTAINNSPGIAVAINLDVAEEQGVLITDELLAMADYTIEGGVGMGVELEIPGVNTFLEDMSVDARIAADNAFLETLRCTDEMIAEQQAALAAVEG